MFFIWNCLVSLLFRLNRSFLFLNSSIVPSSPSALQHSWLWCFELKENLMTKSFSTTQQLSLMLFVISSLLNLNKKDFNQTKFNVFFSISYCRYLRVSSFIEMDCMVTLHNQLMNSHDNRFRIFLFSRFHFKSRYSVPDPPRQSSLLVWRTLNFILFFINFCRLPLRWNERS